MSEIIIYSSSDNATQIEVTFDNETIWLSLNQIAALFGRDKSLISRHLKNIFQTNELVFEATIAKNTTVQKRNNNELGFVNLVTTKNN